MFYTLLLLLNITGYIFIYLLLLPTASYPSKALDRWWHAILNTRRKKKTKQKTLHLKTVESLIKSNRFGFFFFFKWYRKCWYLIVVLHMLRLSAFECCTNLSNYLLDTCACLPRFIWLCSSKYQEEHKGNYFFCCPFVLTLTDIQENNKTHHPITYLLTVCGQNILSSGKIIFDRSISMKWNKNK